MNWRIRKRTLELEGYENKPPSDLAKGIDGMIATSTSCPVCGEKRDYQPMMKGESYRAFAVCHTCNTYDEF